MVSFIIVKFYIAKYIFINLSCKTYYVNYKDNIMYYRNNRHLNWKRVFPNYNFKP